MKFIAIKDNRFLILTPDMNLTELTNEGYILYTEEEYEIYLTGFSDLNVAQILMMLEDKAEDYIEYGVNIWKQVKKKTFAINTYNKSQGIIMTIEEMKMLLSSTDLLEKTLKTGSFDTAKNVVLGMALSLPQYQSIADFVVSEINSYMET